MVEIFAKTHVPTDLNMNKTVEGLSKGELTNLNQEIRLQSLKIVI